ncbi:MAG: TRAP transporter fused permease subunit [Ruminococcaceae bacterium]|nr:TRAP transporter fused permease subunit [Oscillospiraceae bacterium]MBR3596078.1 TRAP transporter fused permease subunit [Clostridia bacterium]
MQEFDRESNTRIFTGWRKNVITGLLCSFSVYMISMALLFPNATKYTKLTTFMAFIIFVGYLIFPAYKAQTKKINHVPVYDIFLGLAGAACFLYYTVQQEEIVMMSRRIGTLQIIIAFLAIILLIELVRRAVGLPIIFVAGAFIVYAAIKAFTENPDKALRNLAYSLFYDVANGLFSTPVYVCTTFIVLFIILGALLERTGIGTFFVDLANSIAGGSVGGPAKVAVISSALEGMYSGSSVANTVGSGSITIPLMKKTGYKPEFAAAVEAAASTGGQIMPPIMGAAAFLMAEITGVPYASIAVTAILPAALYFTGIFLMIHFEAKKLGLKGLPKDAIPNFFKLIARNGYLLLPIIILVICMNYFSAGVSACFAILASLIVSLFPKHLTKKTAWQIIYPLIPVAVTLGIWIPFGASMMTKAVFAGLVVCVVLSFITKKNTALNPGIVVESLHNGAKNTIGVAVACGMAGLISGVVTMTALGQLLLNTLVPVAENSMFLALFLTMLCCIVLGMGVPTTANYVIMATITAPILIKMGIPALAAHMFVFYFGIVADITPPVALAAYAGSAIAKSNPLKTGITATRLAIAAFIIPYMFAYNPKMLFIDAGIFDIISIIITSFVGIYAVAAGMEGYMNVKLPWWQRILTLAGGFMLIVPETITDIIGISLVVAIIIIQVISERKSPDYVPKQKKNKKKAA